MKHRCPESGCLYCMVTDLYAEMNELHDANFRLASENIQLKRTGSSVVERGPEKPGVDGAIPSRCNAGNLHRLLGH